jgi:hypothetical protein
MKLNKVQAKYCKKTGFSFLIFFIFVPFIFYDNGLRCMATPCNSISAGSILIYLLKGNPYVFEINYFIFFGGILSSYLLAWMLFKKE